jgi:hypothetical protein
MSGGLVGRFVVAVGVLGAARMPSIFDLAVLFGLLQEFYTAMFRAKVDCFALVFRMERGILIDLHPADWIGFHMFVLLRHVSNLNYADARLSFFLHLRLRAIRLGADG